MANRITIDERVRREIERRGVTGYRISKEVGVSEPTICRFMHGASMRTDTFDLVCDYLDLQLVRGDELRRLRRLSKGKHDG